MMENKNILVLKSISELLNEKFNIPSYQRGYRWTVRQVEDLLDDILEFQQSKSDGFYCLQPIVVKKNKVHNDVWDVIDGQQRLTSLFILLSYLNDVKCILFGDESKYEIGYETRADSKKFLEEIKVRKDFHSNIDFYHIYQAYKTIETWFNKKNKGDFLNTLLRNEKPNVQIIWYEVEDNQQNEIDIFTRINMGKIPLTNAELIKALLLKKHKDFDEKAQFELASQWDNIEYALQQDDFWFFLNSDDNKATRIEFIFELLSNFYKEESKLEINNGSLDVYYTFHIINGMLTSGKRTNIDIWNDVKTFFRILNEWFENRELFHKIGFLLIEGGTTVSTLISESKNKNKDDFRNSLDKKIKKLYDKVDIENLEYGDKNIKKILLWFNIKTLLNNKVSNARFQFDRYKNKNWDIEHIRSQTDAMPLKAEEKTLFINEYCQDDNQKSTLLKSNSDSDENFKNFYNDIRTQIEGTDFEKASISNLALLDSATNRSYKNAFFRVKRKTILENDMNGTFIPICTRNVFMKYYTKNPENLYQWTEQDAEDYLKAIKETLKDFLAVEQNNEN